MRTDPSMMSVQYARRGLSAYPRSRGATIASKASTMALWGLSPLARGNPTDEIPHLMRPGPIPARAGQPENGDGKLLPLGAYPRSRGATKEYAGRIWYDEGLSPLARGNRIGAAHDSAARRPIPARAGQPC